LQKAVWSKSLGIGAHHSLDIFSTTRAVVTSLPLCPP
jgi:hypothetical protein